MRFRSILIVLGAVLIALTYSFPLWQPLFSRDGSAADQGIPGLPSNLQTIYDVLPPEQQAAYQAVMAQNMQAAIDMLNASLQPPVPAPADMQSLPSMAGPVEVGSGAFERVDVLRWGRGDVMIYQQVDDSKLLRMENFSVASGPSLRVVLSAAAAPLSVEEMRQSELDIDLGQLAGNTGNQHYEIPADTDLAQYRSVVIYSATLNMIYSYAPLIIRF